MNALATIYGPEGNDKREPLVSFLYSRNGTDAAKGNINKGKAETQAISDKEIMRMSKRDFNELQRQNWVGD